ncbi:MAG: hypothetical protein HY512_01325 [Candidatus Aenigmarchaeota archaeon]|nr:hypothetical protein [Candidatus Aenigmarchaeota archaeon]
MVIENLTGYITDTLNQLSVGGARTTLEPLLIFVIGMVIYSVIIFKLYRFISRRDLFSLIKGGRHTKLKKVAFGLEYVFLFPIIAFVWFFVISVLLSMLSSVLAIGNIFMISMSILATIRITSYIHQDLSSEIAKLIPLALLGVLLLDISTFSTETVFNIVENLPSQGTTLIYYFVFIFVIEIVLKVLLFIGRALSKGGEETKSPRKQKKK